MKISASFLVIVLVFAGTATAQVTITAGPSPAPLGSPVLIAVSNDSAANVLVGSICPWDVSDSNGVIVTQPICSAFFAPIPIPPGETFELLPWDQTDRNGGQVAAGTYTIRVFLGGNTFTTTVTLGGTNLGIGQLGTLRPGTTRRIVVSSPAEPGALFLVGASITTFVGIPTCNGTFPLDDDALLNLAFTPGNGVFNGLVGLLDTEGVSRFTSISIPNNPLLSGVPFMVAAATLNLNSPCPVSNISPAVTVTIQ